MAFNASSIKGCLLGCATGDALGFIVEGYGPDVCGDYVKNIVKKQRVCPNPRHPQFPFGQYSDDTQLTRELLISMTQTDCRIDAAAYGLRIALLFVPGAYRVVGYGGQTARGADKIRAGVHPSASGCAQGNGNGGAMRSAIIGLLVEPARITDVARTLSAITHASPRGMDGSVAVAWAAHYAYKTRDAPFDVAGFLEAAAHAVREADFAAHIIRMVTWDQDPALAAKNIIAIGKGYGEQEWHGISCGVVQTVLWALWAVTRAPDSFVDCVAEAIRVGGDVDTTAAIAGAIVGARLGVESIPEVWRRELTDVGEWRAKDLEALVDRVSSSRDA